MFELPMFTLIHVLLSVLGLMAGLVVLGGLLAGDAMEGWTAFFLITTVLTSLTGYGFPFTRVLPPHVVGAVSLAVLALAVVARYGQQMQGRWRTVYVLSAVAALYLNVLVLLVQLFVKTPALAELAPTQQEAPFALTQAGVLLLFLGLGWQALRGFRELR